MRNLSLLAVAGSLVYAAIAPALAQGVPTPNGLQAGSDRTLGPVHTMPVARPNSETVHMGKLPDWQMLTFRSDATGMREEWVHKGDSLQTWSEMVTLRIIRNPDPMPPQHWVQDMLTSMKARCGKFEVLAQHDDTQTDARRAAAGLAADYQYRSG